MRRQSPFRDHKSQVTVFFLSIVALLIVVAFATVNIGKIARDKTNASNSADAGALAACSVMATGFNHVADRNQGETKGHKDDIIRAGKKSSAPQGQSQVPSQAVQAQQAHQSTQTNTNTGAFQHNSGKPSPAAIKGAQQVLNGNQVHEEDFAEQLRVDGGNDQAIADNTAASKDAMDGESGTQNNYYDNALAMGYLYNFYNSGTHLKVAGAKINSKRYEEFLKQITPSTVQNGEPKTFFWVDGAFRAHVVTAIIEIQPADNWNVETAQDTRSQSNAKAAEGTGNAQSGQGEASAGIAHHILGIAQPSLDMTVHAPAGWADTESGRASGNAANGNGQDYAEGRMSSRDNVMKNVKMQSADESIKGINDIYNSQMVYSANFQFHMGGPVKGMRGDVDVPTFYPPVVSSAMASFNYNQRGHIRSQDRQDADPYFECGLISAF
ncbi:MAG: Tad domain-containing protein [Candidatus Omnitrophica bacterium]|nr:Tad domain-containing protein [Candidatus Omnitrophota bacterium]